MRHITSPRFGARSVLIALTLTLACLGTPLADAGASTTTTTQPQNYLVAGNEYARHLLHLQPIPPGAEKVTTLPTPIAPGSDVPLGLDTSHAWALYLLPTSVSVEPFVRAHLPSGETVNGTGTGGGPGVNPVDTILVALTCVSPHITFCGVTYSSTEAKNGHQELRVDAQVTYLPIVHEKMPTGTVAVTGFGKTTAMNGSSDPTSVVLTSGQAKSLRSVVAQLKDFGGGMCMEDSLLLKIKVVSNGHVVWRATADACPGSLEITTPHSTTTLDNRSCGFWHVVDSFFAKGTASGTISESKAICSNPV